MTIIWYMVPEIWSATDRIFLLSWTFFCPFTHLKAKKIKIYKKKKKNEKKNPADIIILHKSTKNHDYRLYCSWDMAHEGRNCYFSFWAEIPDIRSETEFFVILGYFLPSSHLLSSYQLKKWKFKKNKKQLLEISSFYTTVPKIMTICYTVPEI